jgi:hypothetical protein
MTQGSIGHNSHNLCVVHVSLSVDMVWGSDQGINLKIFYNSCTNKVPMTDDLQNLNRVLCNSARILKTCILFTIQQH